MADSRIYWVALNHIKGIGAVRLRMLLDTFGSAQAAWHAPADALRSAGLSAKVIENFLQMRKTLDLTALEERLQAQKIQVILWDDAEYPQLLRSIAQPPPVLYVRGTLLPEDDWAVALVGTRRMTPYGRQVTEELAALLAQHGGTVVSGMARGVDAIAHQTAIRNGGRTLAVLGCGVDRVYPPEHRALAEHIIQHGALISDYAPGTPPDAVNFPPRNRIIAGLSRAVVVVEAGETSGALITADFAAEQGREVFAVPGSIYAPQSKGPNCLIQNGARPLLNAAEILEMLNLNQVVEQRAARKALPADPLEAQLLNLLSQQPVHIDELGLMAELPISQISSTLAIMELKGMVRQVGGMNYVAVREGLAEYQTFENIPDGENNL